MSQIVGAAVGIAIGCIVGLLKNVFVWGSYLKNQHDAENSVKEHNSIMKRSVISYLVCLVILLLIYLGRNIFPFNWMWCLVAAGLSISLMNISVALRKKRQF